MAVQACALGRHHLQTTERADQIQSFLRIPFTFIKKSILLSRLFIGFKGLKATRAVAAQPQRRQINIFMSAMTPDAKQKHGRAVRNPVTVATVRGNDVHTA